MTSTHKNDQILISNCQLTISNIVSEQRLTSFVPISTLANIIFVASPGSVPEPEEPKAAALHYSGKLGLDRRQRVQELPRIQKSGHVRKF